MRTLFYDLRYTLRQLCKTSGVATLAILTLALGVGANTAIFTVIESVLLRPLPYPHSDRLIFIGPPGDQQSFGATSWLNYRDIRDQSREFSAVAAYSEDVGVVENQDGSQSVVAPRVTPNLFSMLGARPLMGRTFTTAEGESGGSETVLLSEGLWRQTFHADQRILGQAVKISGKLHTVVGILPDAFRFPEQIGPDIRKAAWLPLQPTGEMLKDRGYHFLYIVGELRAGVSSLQAQHELDAIAARIPRGHGDDAIAFSASPYQEVLTGPVRPVLYALFGALALVLLIACTNVSNLLIARCLGRQHEFAVRAALGAGRGVGDAGGAEAAGGDHPPRRLHRDSFDHCAGAGCHRHPYHRAFIAATCALGGARQSSSCIAGGFPRNGSPFGKWKAERMAGCGRGCSLHPAAHRNWPTVPHALESGTSAAGIQYHSSDRLHRDARGRGGVFRNGRFRRHQECAGFRCHPDLPAGS
jgi:hypothetical protein